MTCISRGSIYTLLVLAAIAGRCDAQQEKTPVAHHIALKRLLLEPIETKELANPMTLKEALGHLYEMLSGRGKEVPFLVDTYAFKVESPEAPDPYEAQVNLPPVPRQLPLWSALRHLISKVGDGNGTFLVREGAIWITTTRQAAPANLLRVPVTALFDKTPLEDAIHELSRQTGATILIDPRVGERARIPITAMLANTISLEAAVRLLAEFADLRAVVENDILVVTNPARAAEATKGVRLEFRGRRLDDALRELAEATGTTIVLEPVVQQRISEANGPNLHHKTAAAEDEPSDEPAPTYRVSATFRGDVSATAAARILTAMCRLYVTSVDGALYITEYAPGMGGHGGYNIFSSK
jgi:hypothetical protein